MRKSQPTCLCMRELLVRCDVTLLNIYDDQGMYQTSKDIHALVPGHVSNIKGNTCTPLSARCCSAYTVTTGTFDPPTHRDITTIHPVSVIVHTRQLFFVSFNTEMILQIGSWLASCSFILVSSAHMHIFPSGRVPINLNSLLSQVTFYYKTASQCIII